MNSGHLFIWQLLHWGPENTNFEIEFQSASFYKQYHYRLCVNYKMEICENVIVYLCTLYRNAHRCVVFLYKGTSPTTGLAWIIQHFLHSIKIQKVTGLFISQFSPVFFLSKLWKNCELWELSLYITWNCVL